VGVGTAFAWVKAVGPPRPEERPDKGRPDASHLTPIETVPARPADQTGIMPVTQTDLARPASTLPTSNEPSGRQPFRVGFLRELKTPEEALRFYLWTIEWPERITEGTVCGEAVVRAFNHCRPDDFDELRRILHVAGISPRFVEAVVDGYRRTYDPARYERESREAEVRSRLVSRYLRPR